MLRKIINLKRLDEPFNKTFFLLSLINPKPLEKKPFWTDRTPFEPPKSRKFCMFYINFFVITKCSGVLRRPLSRQPLVERLRHLFHGLPKKILSFYL